MKCVRVALAVCTAALFLSGCADRTAASLPPVKPFDELPADYALEEAKADGAIVLENGDCTSGKETLDAFVDVTANGKTASMRLYAYYTLDPASCTPEYYEQNKGSFPRVYITDIDYKNGVYTVTEHEDGKTLVETYRFLKHYVSEPYNAEARFTSCERYVLTNDDSVTWEHIMHGMLSSTFGDFIGHKTVYSKYEWKE